MPPRNWSGRALPGRAQRGQRAQHHRVGAQHHVDGRIGQQDGPHRRGPALLVHRLRRDVGHDRDARQGLQRIAHGDEARRQELQAVVRQQHDPGLAAQAAAYVGRRGIAQHLARQVLRGIEQQRGGRRHDGADIAARPDQLLQAAAEGEGIDGRRRPPRRRARGERPGPARSAGPRRCAPARRDSRARGPWPRATGRAPRPA